MAALLVFATYLGFRRRTYNFTERKTKSNPCYRLSNADDEKAELISWKSMEDMYPNSDGPCALLEPVSLVDHSYRTSIRGCRESDFTSSNEDSCEADVKSKRESCESHWFDVHNMSSSSVRTRSIQDKALKITRKRHRHVKNKRKCPSSSTDTDDNPIEQKRRPTSNKMECHTYPTSVEPEKCSESTSQEDTDNGSSSASQTQRLTRTNSVQVKSWEIRRRRKAKLLKRKAVSFDDIILQGVDRSV